MLSTKEKILFADLTQALFEISDVRDYQFVLWISAGKTNWEIGNILEISEYTVKTHVHRILSKLHLANRAQIIMRFGTC